MSAENSGMRVLAARLRSNIPHERPARLLADVIAGGTQD